MTPSTPPPQAWPTLAARDAPAVIDFLTAIGFTTTVVLGDGDAVVHAELAWPAGGGVMLASEKAPTDEEPYPVEPGTAAVYLVAADAAEVDEIHRRATAAGAEVYRPPRVTDYDAREFAFRDPEGNRWSVGDYRGEPVG